MPKVVSEFSASSSITSRLQSSSGGTGDVLDDGIEMVEMVFLGVILSRKK
jgi:hypothetical protein